MGVPEDERPPPQSHKGLSRAASPKSPQRRVAAENHRLRCVRSSGAKKGWSHRRAASEHRRCPQQEGPTSRPPCVSSRNSAGRRCRLFEPLLPGTGSGCCSSSSPCPRPGRAVLWHSCPADGERETCLRVGGTDRLQRDHSEAQLTGSWARAHVRSPGAPPVIRVARRRANGPALYQVRLNFCKHLGRLGRIYTSV